MLQKIQSPFRLNLLKRYLIRCPINPGSETGNTIIKTLLDLPSVGPYTSVDTAREFNTKRSEVFSDLLDYFFRKPNDAKVNSELQKVPEIHALWALEALLELPYGGNIHFHDILSPLIPKSNRTFFDNVWRQYYVNEIPHSSLGLTSSMREHLIKRHKAVMSNPYC